MATTETEQPSTGQRRGWLSWSSWFRWSMTSVDHLAAVERQVLHSIWDKVESKFVSIFKGSARLRTLSMNKDSPNVPLVMLHGMGAGVGLWVLNLPSLSKTRPVHVMDILGFGRSSRPKFSSDAMLAEMEFVEALEDWRQEMNLEKFILLGHSLGGFIAASYTIRYPERIRHLILADPWGFPEPPLDSERRTPIPMWVKLVLLVIQPFNPLAVLRAAGPVGPKLIAQFRRDLLGNFSSVVDEVSLSEYVYHCNAQQPSGEVAFKHMNQKFGWAKYPMIRRINEIPPDVPMTIIYGSRSWVDSGIGWQIKYQRSNSYVDVQVVKGAGHHVYSDRADLFNLLVTTACSRVDQDTDLRVMVRRRMRSESSPALRHLGGETRRVSESDRRRMKSLCEHHEEDEEEEGEEDTSRVTFSLEADDEADDM